MMLLFLNSIFIGSRSIILDVDEVVLVVGVGFSEIRNSGSSDVVLAILVVNMCGGATGSHCPDIACSASIDSFDFKNGVVPTRGFLFTEEGALTDNKGTGSAFLLEIL